MRYLRKLNVWLRNKHALSPIFATVLLASIIIIFGSVAYYYSSNLTRTATNSYVSSLSDSQQSISERIGFENVVEINSTNPVTLRICIIDSGSANNVQIASVFLYFSSNNTLFGQPIQGSVRLSGGSHIFPLFFIDNRTSIQSNSLNVGSEGYFTVPLPRVLQSGTEYTIHVITQRGSAFDYEFTP